VSTLHVALALLVAVTWGLAFVATRIALDSLSAPQLTALRFILAAVPAAFLARPAVSWSILIAIGATLFTGQFLFQFFAISGGMPPGLAATVVQTQALFTIVLAALTLGQWPTPPQIVGSLIALGGLGVIAATLGEGLTVMGLLLTLGSAVSWGIGNVLLKRLPAVEVLSLVVWTSLVPPVPALALSLWLDRVSFPAALARASPAAIVASLYLGVIATVGAYALWGVLLRRYPAATVTPFALLVPVVAAAASSMVFGERFGPGRLIGMAMILLGLTVIVLGVTPRGVRHMSGGVESLEPLPAVSSATRADAPGVIALMGRVYAEYGFVYEPVREVPDLFDFGRHYEAPGGAFFVVRRGAVVVGSAGVERLDATTAELHRLYLDRDLRGRGVGQALATAVLDWCRSHAIARVILWSDTRFEHAHRLYLRMGFRPTGERELPGDVNHTREYRFERAV